MMAAPTGYAFKRARKHRLSREIEAAREQEAAQAGVEIDWLDDLEDVVLQEPAAATGDLLSANAALVAALSAIVLETMPYAPSRRRSSDSWLPSDLIEDAQQALELATGSRIGEAHR